MSSVSELVTYYAQRALEYEDTVGYSRPENRVTVAPIKARYQLALEGHDVLEIACGPGYWTEVVAATARSVLATDLDPCLVSMARSRTAHLPNVTCQAADAYSLDGVTGHLSAAFAQHWWSHVPKARLRSFLVNLHSKLAPGARVIFLDALPYHHRGARRVDENGDLLEERTLRNGKKFDVIKNFPDRAEILSVLEGIAEQVVYKSYRSESYWTVTYLTRTV